MTKLFMFATALFLQLSLHAQSDLSDVQVEQDAFTELNNALIQPTVYRGLKSGSTRESGTFCNNEKSYWVAWEGRLGDVQFDVRETGEAVVHMEMDRSSVEGAGFRQGGILCTWMGGGGRATVQKTSVDFALYPVNPGDAPRIEIRNAKIQGLALDRIDVALPFFTSLNGEAPDWLNDWLETNINKLVGTFMETTLKKRLDTYLSDKFKEWLNRKQKEQAIILK